MEQALKRLHWTKSYKSMHDERLEHKIECIIQCIDAPKSTNFNVVEQIREQCAAIVPELVSSLFFKMNLIDTCFPLNAPATVSMFIKIFQHKGLRATLWALATEFSYYVSLKCKTSHFPYKGILN